MLKYTKRMSWEKGDTKDERLLHRAGFGNWLARMGGYGYGIRDYARTWVSDVGCSAVRQCEYC